MADFTYIPSFSSQLVERPKKLKVQFGDGYQQRAQDGINTNLKRWRLNFNGLTTADADAIQAFLEGKDGRTNFTWDDPDGNTVTVICEDWNKVFATTASRNMIMTFEEVVT